MKRTENSQFEIYVRKSPADDNYHPLEIFAARRIRDGIEISELFGQDGEKLFDEGYDLLCVNKSVGYQPEHKKFYLAKSIDSALFNGESYKVFEDEFDNERTDYKRVLPLKYNIGDLVTFVDGRNGESRRVRGVELGRSQCVIIGLLEDFDSKRIPLALKTRSRKWLLEHGYFYVIDFISHEDGWSSLIGHVVLAREEDLTVPFENDMSRIDVLLDARERLLGIELVDRHFVSRANRRFKKGDSVVFNDRPNSEVFVVIDTIETAACSSMYSYKTKRDWLLENGYDYYLEAVGRGFGVRAKDGYLCSVASDSQLEIYDGNDPIVSALIDGALDDLRKIDAGEDVGTVAYSVTFPDHDVRNHQ